MSCKRFLFNKCYLMIDVITLVMLVSAVAASPQYPAMGRDMVVIGLASPTKELTYGWSTGYDGQ